MYPIKRFGGGGSGGGRWWAMVGDQGILPTISPMCCKIQLLDADLPP